jgi:hypothetical protein
MTKGTKMKRALITGIGEWTGPDLAKLCEEGVKVMESKGA